METHPEQFTPDQLYDEALIFFRSARWEEAISALRQLQAQSNAYPEAEALIADILLKQEMERTQAPATWILPSERRNRGRGIAVAAVALVALGMLGGLRLLWTGAFMLPTSLPVVSQQAAIGALSTAAPSAPSASTGALASGNGVLTVTQAESVATVDNIYFILDASGSMLARINGQRKIDMAHQAMTALVQDLGGSTNVALRTYGRNRANDCGDIELVNPLGPLNRDQLLGQINAIVPVNFSNTPIGNSLAAISADLAGAKGQTMVVLLSDGEESCNGDPVAEAQRLHTDNPNLRVSVVGFDIAPEFQARLAAVAEAGGGSYFGAANVSQLGAALKQALALSYHVFDADGHEMGSANVGESLKLPAGNYRVTIGSDPALLAQAVDIHKNMATQMALNTIQGRLSATLNRDWVK